MPAYLKLLPYLVLSSCAFGPGNGIGVFPAIHLYLDSIVVLPFAVKRHFRYGSHLQAPFVLYDDIFYKRCKCQQEESC